MSDSATPSPPAALALAHAMVEAIRDGRLDEAEQMLAELEPQVDDPESFLVFPIVIAIQRGRVADALRGLAGVDESKVLELKALCMSLLGDPAWRGLAEEAKAKGDPEVRRAMQALLGEPVEVETPAAAAAPDAPRFLDLPYGAVIRD